MYKELTSEEVYQLFDIEVIVGLLTAIKKEITQSRLKNPDQKGTLYGTVCYTKIPFKSGEKTNTWVEFCSFPFLFDKEDFEVEVDKFFIFDEMPDIFLDRLNEIKAEITSGEIKLLDGEAKFLK
jgi:hypothetical protein